MSQSITASAAGVSADGTMGSTGMFFDETRGADLGRIFYIDIHSCKMIKIRQKKKVSAFEQCP